MQIFSLTKVSFHVIKKLDKNDSHHLEVALLTVVLHQETKCISNPDSRVQLRLLQQSFT